MSNEQYGELVKEIEAAMKAYGFENTTLTQLSFERTSSREMNIRNENEVSPARCRLVQDPDTKKWKVVCP